MYRGYRTPPQSPVDMDKPTEDIEMSSHQESDLPPNRTPSPPPAPLESEDENITLPENDTMSEDDNMAESRPLTGESPTDRQRRTGNLKLNMPSTPSPDEGSNGGRPPQNNLSTPSFRSTSVTGSDLADFPKSPVERVRFILSDNEADEAEEELDLRVHALFCQMDVLCHFEEGEMGWKEAARWLKYEEKVEAGDRWSKPHVATTSLHALFEIRKGMAENQTVIALDMEATHGCMHQVAELIRENIVEQKGWSDEICNKILEVLLKPHKHKHRKALSKKEAAKEKEIKETTLLLDHTERADSPLSRQDSRISKDSKGSASHSSKEGTLTTSTPKKENGLDDTTTSTQSKKSAKEKFQDLKKRMTPDRQKSQEVSSLAYEYPHTVYPRGITPEDLMPHKPNKKLMRKIPGGSETANILIGQVDFLDEPIMVFVRLAKSAVLADLSEVALPSRFLFLCLGPPETTSIWQYEEVGRSMAALFTDTVFCEVAYKAETRQDLVDGIDEFIDDLTVLPPSIWDPSTRLEPPETTMSMDKIRKRLMSSARHAAGPEAFHFAESAGEDETLQRTGRLFGGLVKDAKRRYSQYWSDIRDGFHIQVLAAVVFLYFACITPIVTFGGMMGQGCDGYMGTMESILSGAICGLIYHTFSGQPLTIVGATGPMLVFEILLYHFSHDNGLDFMSFRLWIGLWIALILLLMVAFDLSALVKYITRFTEESFSVLISLIFIAEAFKKVAAIWKTHPIHWHAGLEKMEYKCHCEHPPNMTRALHGDYDADGNLYAPATVLNITNIGHHIKNHPIFETYNWSNMVYEDCITFQHRIVVSTGCITEDQCMEHGWNPVGPACNVNTVTHSVPDVFFLCCFLFIGTFTLAIFFANLRQARYFPSIIRSTVSDFAVLISIIIFTGFDIYLGLDTPKLAVPDQFKTTRDDRSWIINPLALGPKYWLIPLALIPAGIAVILIFLDQQITAIIVNRKEHKLKKGPGYHLDLMILAIIIIICSFMGLPWFVAATVRSVTHVRSLIKESELRVPGERPQFLGVREQRLSGICIHLMIGVSVLLTAVLKHIPMAVLYGVFLYMGVKSLGGVQFVQRIMILFMPAKYQPDYVYLRHVETRRVHIFTAIQILGMVLMWVVKSIKKISLLFPIMILLLCFVRKAMDFTFTQSEMYWLDHILPEEHHRKKEDEEKDIEEGILPPDTDQADGLEKVPVGDEWEEMVAARDYGVGRKIKPRLLSEGVIKRYKDNLRAPNEDRIEEEAVDEQGQPLFAESFRARKFSM